MEKIDKAIELYDNHDLPNHYQTNLIKYNLEDFFFLNEEVDLLFLQYLKAYYYNYCEKYTEANTMFTDLIQNEKITNYTKSYFYNMRGNIKYNKGDYNGAIFDFSNCIKLDNIENSYVVSSYYDRAWSKFKIKDYKGCINDINIYIKIYNDIGDAYRLRGLAKIKLNDKNNGCKDLRKASELGDEFSFDLLRENCN